MIIENQMFENEPRRGEMIIEKHRPAESILSQSDMDSVV
jgi:hypothetical protein